MPRRRPHLGALPAGHRVWKLLAQLLAGALPVTRVSPALGCLRSAWRFFPCVYTHAHSQGRTPKRWATLSTTLGLSPVTLAHLGSGTPNSISAPGAPNSPGCPPSPQPGGSRLGGCGVHGDCHCLSGLLFLVTGIQVPTGLLREGKPSPCRRPTERTETRRPDSAGSHLRSIPEGGPSPLPCPPLSLGHGAALRARSGILSSLCP